jgi:hypothetical protein
VRRLLIAALFSFSVFGFAACGGGGNSDEDQISEVIETTATTNADSNCTDLETQSFVEQANFSTGKDAVAACKDSGPESNADSVKVTEIEVDGDRATAHATLSGSTFDGQTLVVSLVKDGDQWQMDHIDDIVGFDAKRFGEAFAAGATRGGDLNQTEARCIASNFAEQDPGDLKAAVLSGDPTQLASTFQGCLGP